MAAAPGVILARMSNFSCAYNLRRLPSGFLTYSSAAGCGGGGDPAEVASMERGPRRPPRQQVMGGMDNKRNPEWIQGGA